MLPYQSHSVSQNQPGSGGLSEDCELEELLLDMQTMLDRIADCWRATAKMPSHAAAIAGVTSEVVRSGYDFDARDNSAAMLENLRTGIGHVFIGSRTRDQHD